MLVSYNTAKIKKYKWNIILEVEKNPNACNISEAFERGSEMKTRLHIPRYSIAPVSLTSVWNIQSTKENSDPVSLLNFVLDFGLSFLWHSRFQW